MLKKIKEIIFDKYIIIKILSMMILTALSWHLYSNTNNYLYVLVYTISGIYLSLLVAYMLLYAWVINPIRNLIEKRKKK